MISRKPRTVTEVIEALPVLGTLNVDTNTFTPNPVTVADTGEVTEKLGADLLKEAAAEPTLDRYLDRSPKLGAPIDYKELVSVLQRKRQMFITAEAKRKSGVKDDENKEV